MYCTDDPLKDLKAFERKQQLWYDKRPKCAHCEDGITTDQCFVWNGKRYCLDCWDAIEPEIRQMYMRDTMEDTP